MAGGVWGEGVITDHQGGRERRRRGAAGVDPRRPACLCPFKCRAGVGVALKLVLALGGPERTDELLEEYADLAAIGTVVATVADLRALLAAASPFSFLAILAADVMLLIPLAALAAGHLRGDLLFNGYTALGLLPILALILIPVAVILVRR